jgi:hypothetical protein
MTICLLYRMRLRNIRFLLRAFASVEKCFAT